MKVANSKREFNLEAEGIRKMALLWQLVKNGTLEKGAVCSGMNQKLTLIRPIFQ